VVDFVCVGEVVYLGDDVVVGLVGWFVDDDEFVWCG